MGRRLRQQVPAIILAFWGLWAPAARSADVVVVKSKDLRLFDKVLQGFRAVYKGSLDIVSATGDLADPGRLAAAVKSRGAKTVLALGTGAVKRLRSSLHDVPIVFCMVPNAAQKKLVGGNITGIDMETPPAKQLKAYHRLMPAIKRIGVIYNEQLTGAFVKRAAQAADSLGLTLVAVKVGSRKEVPRALEAVVQNSDALWLIRDAMVMTRELFRRALMLQFEKKLPLLVQSSLFVKKQAAVAFAASYESQGRKAAVVVKKILAGTPPGEIPLQAPQGHLSVNLNSATKAGVKLNSQVLGSADVEKF